MRRPAARWFCRPPARLTTCSTTTSTAGACSARVWRSCRMADQTIKAPVEEPLPDPIAPPKLDVVLFAAVLALSAFGVVMVYSASAVYATQKFDSPIHFLKRDLGWTALGMLALYAALRVDYRTWRRWSYPALAVSILLLV